MQSTAILMLLASLTTLTTARPTVEKIARIIHDVVAERPFLGHPRESGNYHQHYHNDRPYYGNGGQPNGYYQGPNGYYQGPNGYYQESNGYQQGPNGGYPYHQRNYPSQPTYVQRPSYTEGPHAQRNNPQGPFVQGNYGSDNGYYQHRGYKTNGY